MNHTLHEWVSMAAQDSIAEAAIRMQSQETHETSENILDHMLDIFHIMQASAQEGLNPDLRSLSGLVGGQAAKLMSYYQSGASLAGNMLGKAEAYSLAIAESNACMGKIVAAPTAGACGILPGCILALMEEKGLSEEHAVKALFVAAAVGESIAEQAGISGAAGGCQEECGAGAAMSAAALTYLMGGTPKQCIDAAAFAIMNLLGLVCDPVGGLVEIPCVYRNVGSCGVAFTAADMVLSGIECPIEPDEVILAMKDVGDALPASLRQTGEGGCASCPSAQAKICHSVL